LPARIPFVARSYCPAKAEVILYNAGMTAWFKLGFRTSSAKTKRLMILPGVYLHKSICMETVPRRV